MSKTLNKDGTPRKIGSGKTKGAGCFSSTTWSVLKNYIADDVEFPISRVWLRDLGALKEDQAAVKKIAVPTILPRERTKVSPPEVKKEKAEEAETSTAKVEKVESSEAIRTAPSFCNQAQQVPRILKRAPFKGRRNCSPKK